MAVTSAVAAVIGALTAGGAAVSANEQAQSSKRARKRGEQRAAGEKAVAEGRAASQARQQRTETIRQSKEGPDIAALIAEAEKPAGADSTFLTGPQGQGGQTGQMGRNKLLGQ